MEIKTAIAILDEYYNEDEYEIIEDCVDNGHVKHDTTAYYTIVLRKSDNTFWGLNFVSSYSYGREDDSIAVVQVEKTEVVRTIWKVVK